jgi:nucleotide-binding universal stress UspA family protein
MMAGWPQGMLMPARMMPLPTHRRKASPERPMIKDVMVMLEGSKADDMRLAAAKQIAGSFDGQVIGLFVNRLPMLIMEDEDGLAGMEAAELIQQARELGDKIEADLKKRLAKLGTPGEVRRFDVIPPGVAAIAAREARSADAFIALRPNGEPEDPAGLVESVLFESGRHLFLVPAGKQAKGTFDRVLIAWNASRESTRALAEAMPYLHKAKEVTVVVVDDYGPLVPNVMMGADVVEHLKHHGIEAVLQTMKSIDGDVGATLLTEAEKRKADLLVMGGYGHARLREWLLGGVTRELLHHAPLPLVVAH